MNILTQKSTIINWYYNVLKQYATFSGRSRRKEYWMFFLFNLIITYGIIFIAIGLEMPTLSIVSTIYSFAVFIPIYNLILACTDSEAGSNKWGPNPKSDTEEIDQIGQE